MSVSVILFPSSHPTSSWFDRTYPTVMGLEAMSNAIFTSHQALELDNHLLLSSVGCVGHDQTKNCTLACSQGSTLFGTSTSFDANATHTLFNCLMYPVVAQLLSAQKLTEDAQSLALQMGFTPDDAASSKVNETSWDCMRWVCAGQAVCRGFSPYPYLYYDVPGLTKQVRSYTLLSVLSVPLVESSCRKWCDNNATTIVDT